jgi:hypothetical protein
LPFIQKKIVVPVVVPVFGCQTGKNSVALAEWGIRKEMLSVYFAFSISTIHNYKMIIICDSIDSAVCLSLNLAELTSVLGL